MAFEKKVGAVILTDMNNNSLEYDPDGGMRAATSLRRIRLRTRNDRHGIMSSSMRSGASPLAASLPHRSHTSAREMSSRQFSFYATPADQMELLRAIHSLAAPFVIVEVRKATEGPAAAVDFAAVPDLACVLALQEHIAELQWTVLRTGGEVLNITTSPVIEVLKPFFDGNEMSRGRFYYTTRYYGGDRRLVSKPSVFLDWANEVFRAVKKTLAFDKNLTPFHGDYVGRDARAWINERGGHTVSATGRIIVSATSMRTV
jgi:hypothetical protein